MTDQPKDITGLFVRIPSEQARRLDRASFALGRAKQDIVSELLDRHVDELDPRQRKITVEAIDSGGLVVGHASAIPRDSGPRPWAEVLTLDEAAALLRVEPEVMDGMAHEGRLPARRIGSEWRFHRRALLDWLAAPPGPTGSGDGGE